MALELDVILELLVNLTILVSLTIISGFVDKRWPRNTRLGVLLQGFLFGAMSIIGMLRPLDLGHGLIFDGRSVMVGLCALYFGPLATVVGAALPIVLRITMGGVGMHMGVMVVASAAILGLVAHYRLKSASRAPSTRQLYVLGLAIHFVMVALMFTLPEDTRWVVIRRLAMPVIVLYPLAMILAGKILSETLDAELLLVRLRNSEMRFRGIFERSTVGKSVTAPDGTMMQVNQAFASMVGRSIEEMQQINFAQITHPDDVAESRECMRQLLADEQTSFKIEKRYIHSNGSIVWVEMSTTLLRNSRNEPLFFTTSISDITDRKTAVDELRISERALKESQRIAHIGSWRLDVATNRVVWSEELYKMYGFDPTVPPPDYTEHQKLFLPESWALLSSSLQNTRDTGNPYDVELQTVRKDGSNGWMWAHGEAVAGADGKTVELWGVAQDISERKRAEQENLKLESQLQQAMKMEAVGRLAGGIAHDFNNLLTGIIGNVQLALMKLNPKDPLSESLTEVDKAARSAATLTSQLLAFSRKQIVEPRVLSLNEIILSVQKMLARLIREDIELIIVPGENLGSVKVDRGQIEQVLVNLAVNARDAMPLGGRLTVETGNIELDEQYCSRHVDVKPGKYVMLAVSDNGTGMTEEVKAHMFEPFYTTKARGRGTGLGLATILGAVSQAGGCIDVYSEEGAGTTFKIYLPLVTQIPDKIQVITRSPEMPHGTETVLLVEDEGIVREVATRILTRLGYKVLDAPDGAKGLAAATEYQGQIDLLMTDVVMPGMNGRQLADHLVAARPGIKVLFSSGYTEDAIAHHGIIDEGLNFIGKPYTPDALARKLRDVLDG